MKVYIFIFYQKLARTLEAVFKHKHFLSFFLIGLIYWRVYDFQFVYWDDNSHVFANPNLTSFDFSNWIHIWTHDYRGFYIPVTYSFWGFLSLFFGFDPGAFHCANLILHTINTYLVYGLFKFILDQSKLKSLDSQSKRQSNSQASFQAGSNESIAYFGALIFALHPIQVEAVAWVTGAKDLLATLFSLLAIRFYLKSRHNLSTVYFVLAVLSKPAAVGLPLIIIVLNCLFLGKTFKKSLNPLSAWIAIGIILGIFTKYLQPDSKIDFVAPLWLRPFVAADAFSLYLKNFTVSVHLTPIYGRTPLALMEHLDQKGVFGSLSSFLLPSAIFSIALAMLRKHPWVLGSLLIFGIAMAPVSGISPFIHQNFSTVTDHYAYFPFFGIILGVICLLKTIENHFKLSVSQGMGPRCLGICILAALSLLSARQLSIWENDDTFFVYALKNAPNTAILESNYGVSLFNRNLLPAALQHFKKAAELKRDSTYFNNVGSTLVRLGKTEEAKAIYQQGLEINPNDEQIKGNLNLLSK